MDDKKWEERTHVGPYQLEEQMPQSADSPGELYRATNEESGATALVLKPATGADEAPIPDLQVRFIASQEEDYLALEVKDSRRARAPDRHSADALVPLLGDVHEGVGRMARALDGPEEPRVLWRLGVALASAVAVFAVLFFMVGRVASVSPPPSSPQSVASTPPRLPDTEEPPSDGNTGPSFNAWLSDTVDAGVSVIARPLPREPFKGQKRPPCTRYVEVELVGGCWAEHALKAPCPDTIFEYQGKCYLPSFSAKPPPQSSAP